MLFYSQETTIHFGYPIYLIGGLEHFLFSIIYGIILPIDEYFSRWLNHQPGINLRAPELCLKTDPMDNIMFLANSHGLYWFNIIFFPNSHGLS